jgi:arylsulfatase
LGGFSLYVKDHHLVYDCNFYEVEHDVLTSSTPLPQGKLELVYEFTREDMSMLRQGTGRMFINGQEAGEAKMHGPSAGIFGSFDIGQARISPVSSAYTLPFKFTGSIEKVRVELK